MTGSPPLAAAGAHAMLWPMQPDTGGRFNLLLLAHDPVRAGYALTLTTAAAEWSTEASVSITDGDVQYGTWRGHGAPPTWLLQYARAALRTAWHAHHEQGWPRRLTRWRDVPARAGSSPENDGERGAVDTARQGGATEQAEPAREGPSD
jgi:hypothetical protein